LDEQDDEDVQEEEAVVDIPGRGDKLVWKGSLGEACAEVVESCPEGDVSEQDEF